ncbi:hypothetical protein [Phenylobacterium sp.]|uniref:hypothetical protein n=1 Tax=Phenylobacterium sp. TaxID=1871053 RepID=UPI002F4101A1
MRDFVDLEGASGATYRFRLAPNGVVSTPMAGNYALLRMTPQGGVIVETIAATNDLSNATAAFRRSAAETKGLHLYTRLNVSAAVREAERADIAALK